MRLGRRVRGSLSSLALVAIFGSFVALFVYRDRYERKQWAEAEEARVVLALERAFKAKLLKTPRAARVDRVAIREGEVVGVVEIKRRRNPAGKYPTVWVEAAKDEALRWASSSLGVPGVFAVGWDDAVGWIPANAIERHGPPVWRDRTAKPRGDANDGIMRE